MNNLSTTVCLLFVTFLSSTAFASHDSPLYGATDRYRDAVVDFERHVIRARTFERHDVRLVDDLEDSTSRLRSAARHVHRSPDFDHRFDSALRTIVKLQDRVEHAIFGQACYRPSPELSRCWSNVVHTYAAVINVASCLNDHGHRPVQESIYRQPNVTPRFTPPFAPQPFEARPFTPQPFEAQRFAPEIIQPAPIGIPQRRSVDLRQRSFDHHAAMQIRMGAMLQRR